MLIIGKKSHRFEADGEEEFHPKAIRKRKKQIFTVLSTTHFCGRPTPTVDRRRSAVDVVVLVVELRNVNGDDEYDGVVAFGDDGSSDFIDRRADFPIARGPTLSVNEKRERDGKR